MVLLPFFLERVGWPYVRVAAVVVAVYALVIGLLMVSRMPTLSGKRIGQRIPRDKVMPVLVLGVLLVALLASYPFSFLADGVDSPISRIFPFAWRALEPRRGEGCDPGTEQRADESAE